MDPDDFEPEAPEAREIGREQLEGADGLQAIVTQLYRGEIDREVNWRQRLDSTTNWAVTVIAGILAYSFSNDSVSHAILLVAAGIGVVFLLVEARRFQRYDVWRTRVRSMQENFFANALDPSAGVEQHDWRRQLSEHYRNPEIAISLRSALSHRLRRVYLPLLVGLAFVWLLRLGGADEPAVEAAGVASVPGPVVLGVVAVAFVGLFAVAFWPGRESVSELNADVDRGDLEKGEDEEKEDR